MQCHDLAAPAGACGGRLEDGSGRWGACSYGLRRTRLYEVVGG